MKITATDTSHLIYRLFHERIGNRSRLNRREYDIVEAEVIAELKKLQKGSDKFITAFDDKHSWRTQYTMKHGLKKYKSNRYKVKTLKDRNMQKSFNKLRDNVEKTLKESKDVIVLKGSTLEADDILAGVVDYKKPNDKLKIYTLDKDLSQLTNKTVKVYNIADNKQIKKTDIEERVLRGRSSYSVNSVFSKLSNDKYSQYKNGDVTLNELFDDVNSNPVSKMHANTRYKHNQVLLDVTKQPTQVKNKVKKVVKQAF